MLKYDIVKRDRRKLLALTGLTVKEFKALLPAFTEVDDSQRSSEKTLAGHKRQRSPGGGRPGQPRHGRTEVVVHLSLSEDLPFAGRHG